MMMEEEINRNVNINYQYNNNTLEGSVKLYGSKVTDIQVRFMKEDENCHNYAVSVSHNHHLPPLFVDMGGNERDENKPDVYVYPKIKRTLKDYIDHLKVNEKLKPIMLYTNGMLCMNGKPDPAETNYVPEEYRRIVRAILKAVVYLHNNSKCLYFPSSLSLENVGIYGEYLRIWGVSYDTLTDSAKADDFHAIHLLIYEQIFEMSTEIPHDMDNLLNMLRDYESHTSDKSQFLIENHYATMSHSERIQFMMNLHNKNVNQSPQPSQKSYAQAVGKLTSKTGWKSSITNGVGKYVFNPVSQCYKISIMEGHYVDDEKKKGHRVRTDLIRMCRNIATHLRSQANSQSDRDVDIMMTACFGQMLVEMAKCLLDVNKDLFSHFVTWKEYKW